ncbi:hypothetical protein WMY93_029786 [Mugilogobius chulae]|uniref:Uncharacterized protein n=1 Tax=Mugilogobius chulae TaxID=88201 RepID=A0AAW0MQG3_9GOBI
MPVIFCDHTSPSNLRLGPVYPLPPDPSNLDLTCAPVDFEVRDPRLGFKDSPKDGAENERRSTDLKAKALEHADAMVSVTIRFLQGERVYSEAGQPRFTNLKRSERSMSHRRYGVTCPESQM